MNISDVYDFCKGAIYLVTGDGGRRPVVIKAVEMSRDMDDSEVRFEGVFLELPSRNVNYDDYCKNDIQITKNLLNRHYGLFDASKARDAMNDRKAQISHVRNEKYFGIKKVIFNDPATIVFWADGSKTVVKCQEGDIFDPEKGMAMAISKRALGDKGNFNDVFKKWVPEPEPISVNQFVEGVVERWKRNILDGLFAGDPKTYKKPEGEIKPIWESEDDQR